MTTDLERVCNRYNIRAISVYGGVPPNPDFRSHAYKVTLLRRNPKRQMTVPFYMGPALCKEPTAADVLSCMISDTSSVEGYSFEEWCHELGFNPDSKKAEKTYNLCKEQAKKLRRFLADNFDTFAHADH